MRRRQESLGEVPFPSDRCIERLNEKTRQHPIGDIETDPTVLDAEALR